MHNSHKWNQLKMVPAGGHDCFIVIIGDLHHCHEIYVAT